MKIKVLREKKVYRDIREMVEFIGAEYEGRPAYRFRIKPHDKEAVVINYEVLREHIRSLTTELLERGYKGKHIALIGKHSYSWIITYYAVLCADAVLVPLDKDWGAEELAETVKSGDCELVIADNEISAKADEICNLVGIGAPVLIDGEGELSLNSWREAGAQKLLDGNKIYFENEINPDKLSLLVFTSGTTGKGKGVMLSQTNFMSDLADVLPFIDFSTKCMNVLPPHHTYGSSVSIFGQNSIGCDVYISSGVKYIVKELNEHKPGHLVAVPLYVETFYRKILKGIKDSGKEGLLKFLMKLNNGFKKIGLNPFGGFFRKKILGAFGGELNMIISGGAPLNQDMADLFASLGVKVLNGYGITECAPILAVNHNNYIVPKSVGPVLPIVDARIDDPNENGEGEIEVKGPNVMLGYYKDEEANAQAFTEDGYFRTGDFGKLEIRRDGARVLYITGRLKNIIILSNGKNVYPEEIEDALSATPGVVDIVVYEGKSRRGDAFNAIVAEIYPDKTLLEDMGITDFKAYFQKFVDDYNRSATPYKKIGVLKVREEEFPKNTLRKILRRKMDMSID